MEPYLTDRACAALEQALASQTGAARLHTLQRLAWHWRARDTARSQAYIDAGEHLFAERPDGAPAALPWLTLAQAFADGQRSRPAQAAAAAQRALEAARQQADGRAEADACLVLASPQVFRGAAAQRDALLRQAREAARRAADPVREDLVCTIAAMWRFWGDPTASLADSDWAAGIARAERSEDPLVRSRALFLQGVQAMRLGDLETTLRCHLRGSDLAEHVGDRHMQLQLAMTVSAAFEELGNPASALEWARRMIDLATQGHWPEGLCAGLYREAQSLRSAREYRQARASCERVLAIQDGQPPGLTYWRAMIELGHNLAELGELPAAQDALRQALAADLVRESPELVWDARVPLAWTLVRCGRPDEAEQEVAALDSGPTRPVTRQRQAELARLRAAAHRARLPAGEQRPAAWAPIIDLLREALAGLDDGPGQRPPRPLLEELANAHLACGEAAQASAVLQRLVRVIDAEDTDTLHRRLTAVRVQSELAAAEAQARHHQRLAESEAARAAVLAQTNETLRHLVDIGREISARLSIDELFATLAGHLGNLFALDALVVWLADADGRALVQAFSLADDGALPMADARGHAAMAGARRLPLDDGDDPVVRCARTQRVLGLDDLPPPAGHDAGAATGAVPVCGPLVVGDRLLGVLQLRIAHPGPERERQRLVLRTLCAQVATALHNGELYSQSEQARRRLEQATQMEHAAREQAEQATRMKSRFLATLSHELRTPLHAINGFSELLRARGGTVGRAQQAEWTDRILGAGHHLLLLIDDLLDVARIEAGRPQLKVQTLAPLPLVRKACREMELAAGLRRMTLSVQVAGEPLPDVSADPRRLEQVLLNLLSNGIKYGREGGRLQVGLRAADGAVHIDVSDDGAGMTAAQLQRLFRPFDRLGQEATPTEGTGIGLSISKSLVELMQGRLGVRSRPGQGSTFTVTLPRARAPADGAAEPGTAGPASSRPARGRVLYIDDDPVNCLLIQAYAALRPRVELRTCPDATSGLATFDGFAPDLVLIDANLPDMSGTDLLRTLRARPAAAARPPCLALSADAMPEAIGAALAAGFEGYLTKPLPLEAFLSELDRWLAPVPP